MVSMLACHVNDRDSIPRGRVQNILLLFLQTAKSDAGIQSDKCFVFQSLVTLCCLTTVLVGCPKSHVLSVRSLMVRIAACHAVDPSLCLGGHIDRMFLLADVQLLHHADSHQHMTSVAGLAGLAGLAMHHVCLLACLPACLPQLAVSCFELDKNCFSLDAKKQAQTCRQLFCRTTTSSSTAILSVWQAQAGRQAGSQAGRQAVRHTKRSQTSKESRRQYPDSNRDRQSQSLEC